MEALLGRIELIPEQNNLSISKNQKTLSNKIFIVHGRDEEVKAKVARFVEKLGLKAIILHCWWLVTVFEIHKGID